MDGIDLTVSIVNWNTKEPLRACVLALLRQTGCRMEIIVSDNASSDGSAEMVRGEFGEKVALIVNSENLGFGAAHNKAIKQAQGKYIFVLNPDSHPLSDDMCCGMAHYMDDHPEIGALGPKILNPDGSLQFSARRFPNPFAGIFRGTQLGKMFPNNRFVRSYLMTDFAHDQIAEVDWLSGAALVFRKQTLDRVGLFDERFYMYCEDMDICRRIGEAGWKVVYYPLVAVSHTIGAASDQAKPQMIREHHKSMLLYFLKYNSRRPTILLTPVVMAALWLRCRALLRTTR